MLLNCKNLEHTHFCYSSSVKRSCLVPLPACLELPVRSETAPACALLDTVMNRMHRTSCEFKHIAHSSRNKNAQSKPACKTPDMPHSPLETPNVVRLQNSPTES